MEMILFPMFEKALNKARQLNGYNNSRKLYKHAHPEYDENDGRWKVVIVSRSLSGQVTEITEEV